MRQARTWGWLGALAIGCLALTSGSRLNTSWLVPAGHVRIDYKALAQPELKICALTFDDGPDSLYTPAVAAILAQYKIHATFFVVGTRVKANPKVLLALAAAGHEIGNHSQSHPHMPQLNLKRQSSEIQNLQHTLSEAGITAKWFRPPYGAFDAVTIKVAAGLGLDTILWSVDPRDWAEPGIAKIQARVLGAVTPGAVVLLHCTHGQTVQALPGIIEGLQKRGYRFVTMSEWAAAVSGGPLPTALPTGGAPPPGLQIEPEQAFDLPPGAETQRVPPPGGVNAASETAPLPSSTGVPVTNAGRAGLIIQANFADAGEALQIWSGKLGKVLRAWTSALPAGANPAILPSETVPNAEPAAPTEAPATGSPATFTLQGDQAWGGAWQRPAAISFADITANEQPMADSRFRPEPRYYLLIAGAFSNPSAWSALNSYADLGHLDGAILGSQSDRAAAASFLATASAAVPPEGKLAPDAVVDLGLQGLPRILAQLKAGYGNVYLAIRPTNIAGFTSTDAPLGLGQRDFVLLRRLTQGMNLDAAPENDLAPTWPLPDGIRMVRFMDANHEVLALYPESNATINVGLPADAHQYQLVTLNDQNQVVFNPMAEQQTAVTLTRNALLLYRELP